MNIQKGVTLVKFTESWNGDLIGLMKNYKYQQDLTHKMDNMENKDFSQTIINEIVLWKVNRYVELNEQVLAELNSMSSFLPGAHRKAESILNKLLGIKGVDLPMASTLLRFRNPRVFQIIDRHAYRAVYGNDYPLHSATDTIKKIHVYFEYLDKLVELATIKKIDYQILDRVLYIFDKEKNGKL
jgi:thermostable 8-oxoguanine DNA glycosylase